MSRFRQYAVLTIVTLTLGACSNDEMTTEPSPPPVLIENTWDATLTPNGAQIRPFTATRAGQVVAQVTALDPADAVIGLSLGTWSPNACQVLLDKNDAVLNTSLLGSATTIGTYCIRIYDMGTLTGPVDVTIAYSHY